MCPLEYHLPSPAKINLGLRILGKRADAYHAIQTILQMLDLCDWLTLRVNDAGNIRLTCSTPTLPTDEGNLVIRAARLLQRRGKVPLGVDIYLEKRIPLAAGLGGGSSDAATTLLTLNRLWDLHWDATRLQQMAAQLGSDVPFFLGGPTALAQGRGEEVKPLPPPALLTGVLVNPGFEVPAGWAYAHFNGQSLATDQTMATIMEALGTRDLARLADALVNDLEPGVAAVYPAIREMKDRLRSAGAAVTFMCGSGPTVCGIFQHPAEAQQAATHLPARQAWVIIPFATICQSPHTERWG